MGGLRETFKQMSLQQNRYGESSKMTNAHWQKLYAYRMLVQCGTYQINRNYLNEGKFVKPDANARKIYMRTG